MKLHSSPAFFSTTMLVPEPSIPISPTLALALGGDLLATMILQQLHFWVITNMVGVEQDGRRWVRQALEDWHTLMPYATPSSLRRAIKVLETKGVIQTTSSLNGHPFDRSKWYSIDYEAIEALVLPVLRSRLDVAPSEQPIVTNATKGEENAVFSDVLKTADASDENEKCNCSNPTDATAQNEQLFLYINNINNSMSVTEKNTDGSEVVSEQSSGTPTKKKRSPGTPTSNPRHERLLEIWNEHRGPLAKAKRVTAKYAAGFNRLIQDYGDDTEDNFRLAVQRIVSQGYYMRDGVPQYGLENLLAADNYIKHIENALAAKKVAAPAAPAAPRPQSNAGGFELKSAEFVPPDVQRLARKSLDELREYLGMGLDGTNQFVRRAVEGIAAWEVTTLEALHDPQIPSSLLREAVERYPQYQLDSKLF